MERLLKVAQVQERTQLSRSLIYELIASGELPSVAIGRTRRIPENRLEQWVQRHIADQERTPNQAA